MGKIKDTFWNKWKRTEKEIDVIKKTIESQIEDEQAELDRLNIKLNDEWNKYHEHDAEKNGPDEEIIAVIDVLTQEIERRTKRVHDLLRQLDEVKNLKKKVTDNNGQITPDTVFKACVYLGGIALVLYAEESRPLISKAMTFLVKPRL